MGDIPLFPPPTWKKKFYHQRCNSEVQVSSTETQATKEHRHFNFKFKQRVHLKRRPQTTLVSAHVSRLHLSVLLCRGRHSLRSLSPCGIPLQRDTTRLCPQSDSTARSSNIPLPFRRTLTLYHLFFRKSNNSTTATATLQPRRGCPPPPPPATACACKWAWDFVSAMRVTAEGEEHACSVQLCLVARLTLNKQGRHDDRAQVT